MGTRCLVHFKDTRDGETFCTIYRQFDGYPSGMGDDLKKVLGDKVVVNGYTDRATQVNGMGCAAAMAVAALKDECGNVYLRKPGTSGVGEEYVYTLWAEGLTEGSFGLEGSGSVFMSVDGFDGPLAKFDGVALEEAAA